MSGVTQHKSGGLRGRMLLLGGSALALVVLAAALWYAMSARAALSQSLQQLADAEIWQREAQRLDTEFARWQQWQDELLAFQQGLQGLELTPEQWRIRTLTIEREVMTRERTGSYLSSLVNRDGYLFLPNEFSLRVIHDGDGLLRWHPRSTNDLELTLSGDYMIRQLFGSAP